MSSRTWEQIDFNRGAASYWGRTLDDLSGTPFSERLRERSQEDESKELVECSSSPAT